MLNPFSQMFTSWVPGLAPGASTDVTINITSSYAAIASQLWYTITCIGEGSLGTNPSEMYARIKTVSPTSVVVTVFRDSGGASFQSSIIYLTVNGMAVR